MLIGWPGGEWQATARLAGTIVFAYLALLWLATILWAYRDMRARTRDPVSLAVGVTLVTAFPLFGVALYLLARPRDTIADAYARELEDAAMRVELRGAEACPGCRRAVLSEFVFCPYCRSRLREPCSNCPQLLAADWRHCSRCGASRSLREPSRAPAEQQRPRVARAAAGAAQQQPREARDEQRRPPEGARPARREPGERADRADDAPRVAAPRAGARPAVAPDADPDR